VTVRDGTTAERLTFQRQARALGDPTRYRIFRYIAESAEPVSVADLTEHLGLHRNGIRQHLGKLCEAGLLIEEQAPATGPGRPRLQYRLSPSAAGKWGVPGPYEDLALLLVRLQRSDRSPREEGIAVGRQVADGHSPATALQSLEGEMSRWAFEPRLEHRGSTIDLIADSCPFVAAASAAPEVVCEIHRGLVEGVLDAAGGSYELTGVTRRDPARAGCRFRIRGPR
jgi:predicted ArsR family transcriptional regulator